MSKKVVKLAVAICSLFWNGSDALGQNSLDRAATVAQARDVLDLSAGTLIEPQGVVQTRVAFQSFLANGNASTIAHAVDAALKSKGLRQRDGASFSDAYCSASYEKSGFSFTLMVMPSGQPDAVNVTVTNQGDVDAASLPKPDGTSEVFVQPWSAMYVCDLPADRATRECRKLLEASGWEWFGDTTSSFFMRQNAVRVQVMCSQSPAQPGKTSLHYSTELMSSELPIIAGLSRVAYSDGTKKIDADSKRSTSDLLASYRTTLEADRWRATTDNPIKSGFKDSLVFVNDQKEVAELEVHQVEEYSRFSLEFKSASEVETENHRARLAIAAAAKKHGADQLEKSTPTRIEIPLPKNATLGRRDLHSLEFSVNSGTAQIVVETWLATQVASGWVVQTQINSRQVGELALTKRTLKLSVSFVDPGFVPGKITISSGGNGLLTVADDANDSD